MTPLRSPRAAAPLGGSSRADASAPAPRPRAPRRGRTLLLPLAAAVLPFACQEQLPTSEREDLVPSGIVVDVVLPFGEFASDLRVYGGFGRTSERAGGFVAHQFGAGAGAGGEPLPALDSRTLVRLGAYPASASVRDTAGTLRQDSSISFASGRIVAVFDTVGSVLPGPVEVVAHEIGESWDHATATWSHAVDTVGGRVLWSEAGGGPAREVARGVWERGQGDSLFLPVDSARVHAWADTASEFHGIRLEAATPGARLELRSMVLSLHTLPSINPDTVVDLRVPISASTFVYDPPPPAPAPGEARVGGVPAWRSVLDLDLPNQLDGPPYLCTAVSCPVRIDDRHVSYAALRLVSRVPAPAFAPSDTLGVEVRTVLAPGFLPKSPLGPAITGLGGARVAAEWFAPPAGHVVEVPVTGLVRDMLRRGEPDDTRSATIALLAPLEPLSLEYVSFEGADPAAMPRLRLILNFSEQGR